MAAKKPSLSDRIVPFLVLVSVGLAFGVGILWQRVSNLGVGSKSNAAVNTNVGSNNAAGSGEQEASVLEDLVGLATSLGVDKGEYESCVNGSEASDAVETFYQSGVTAGVRGTPGSFIINSSGEVWSVPGAVPYVSLKASIEVALRGVEDSSNVAVKLTDAEAQKVRKTMPGDHLKGNNNAPVYLIEYSDFQCPYCQSFHPSVENALSEYDGQVALVYRHFPLDQLHPLARPAAVASECVAKLGGEDAFWKFVDRVFAS